ncbi:MAG: lytic transglycosylase domain-containing protein [Blastocatellia bacterium]|nr:lytic transglycosylase domain-containing protein [Blastocatellia bacterium]
MPFKKLIFGGAAFLALGSFSTDALAQNPVVAPQGVNAEKFSQPFQDSNDLTQRVIRLAEQQYKVGEQQFNNGSYEQARESFDKAIDLLLEADTNVRKDSRFRAFYLDIVERIYRHQVVAAQGGTDGCTKQLYESSPLDELAKMDLDAEGVSNEGAVDLKDLDFQVTSNPSVVQFINFFTQGKGRSTMETGLRRSGRYRAMAERIFKEEGVPLDIVWLAQVESVWVPYALSQAAAKGIWQFIPGTGARFGLRQDGWIDERVSPEKSTRAAARYLKFLNEFFAGDWLLAMAAYNCGEYGVDRAISKCGYADFWELYNRNLLPQETRNYVPAILAVTIIAKNPEKYGFKVQPDPEWSYDTYDLNSQVDLRVVASALNVSYETIRDLNPELKRGVTPENYSLRLPKNSREQFEAAFTQLDPNQYLLSSYSQNYKRSTRQGSSYRVVAVSKKRSGSYKVKHSTAKKVYSGKRGWRR